MIRTKKKYFMRLLNGEKDLNLIQHNGSLVELENLNINDIV